MKAKIFASALLLFAIYLPLHAAKSQSYYQTTKATSASTSMKINLNKADLKSLSKSIKGIGPKRAEAIINYRREHGRFNSIKDLAKVRGFSSHYVQVHLAKLKEVFTVN
ncbi:MAG: helix-hairpin-helix domain-containing protein [Tatlockia sp.]|nr:helix-hairpin-helix domain-containing protein [Tatlockia sp.]